MRRTDKINWR